MELYDKTAFELSKRLTLNYSTSFSLSSLFFTKEIRRHIYAIYGLARIADEIVDTYRNANASELLDNLEGQVEKALLDGYSTNPIIHAFALSARQFKIDTSLTRPFFKSMRMDLSPQTYSDDLYNDYIYGSAEVIGLMCLRVFVDGNETLYEELAPGARALGSAYQKVNFLRDLRDDYVKLGRVYFPEVNFETFDSNQKQKIETDIESDFKKANSTISKLPRSAKSAVKISYDYYYILFKKLQRSPIDKLKTTRVRIPDAYKLVITAKRLIVR